MEALSLSLSLSLSLCHHRSARMSTGEYFITSGASTVTVVAGLKTYSRGWEVLYHHEQELQDEKEASRTSSLTFSRLFLRPAWYQTRGVGF